MSNPLARCPAKPLLRFLVATLLVPFVHSPVDVHAQSLPGHPKRWEPISNGSHLPVFGATEMVLDQARRRAYVHTRSTIWSLDLATGEWSSFTPSNHVPFEPAILPYATERLLLDPQTDRLFLVHGPEDTFSQWVPGSTWVLPLATPTAWTFLARPVSTNGPYNKTPVLLDAARRRILSFSGHYDGWSRAGVSLLSLSATTPSWTILPTGVPLPRTDSNACLDIPRGRMWMWGWGNLTNPHLWDDEVPGTLWAYDHGAATPWRQVPTVRPPDTPTNGLITHDPVRDRLLHVDGTAGVWALQIAPDGLSGTWSHTFSQSDLQPSGSPTAQVYDDAEDRLLVLVGSRVWALRLYLPDPPPPDDIVADEEVVVRPRRDGIGVAFVLATEQDARVDVFDVRGRRVAGVDGGTLAAGPSTLDVSMRGRPAGVYFVRAKLGATTVAARRVVFTP